MSLEGATIREDRRSLVAIYGRAAVMQAALSGRLPVPPAARSFLAVVDGIVQYVPHGEIGALRATFLGERRIVSADPRPDKAQFQDRQSAEPCATPVAGLICDSQFPMSYKQSQLAAKLLLMYSRARKR